MQRAMLAFVTVVIVVLSLGPPHAAAQQVAECPQDVSLVPSLVPPEPGRSLNRIETSVTPALNIRPVTYDSMGRNGISEPDAFHVLYFVDRRVPDAGGTAIADTFHILSSGAVTQIPGEGSSPARTVVGPRELLVGGGSHRVTAVLIRNDNVVCEARGAIEFALPGSSDEVASLATTAGIVAAIVAGAFGVVVAMYLHSGRLSLSPRNPFQLLLGSHEYDLKLTKGPARGVTTRSTTELSVSGGGGGYQYVAPLNISSKVTVHDQFFIVARDGAEKAVRLTNWTVSLADGHVVSALEPFRRGAAAGYLLIRNHATGENLVNEIFLKSRYRRRRWMTRLLELVGAFPAAALGVAIGSFLAGGRASDDVATVQAAGLFGGFLAFLVGAAIGSLLWKWTSASSLQHRFFKDEFPKLLAAIDDAPMT